MTRIPLSLRLACVLLGQWSLLNWLAIIDEFAPEALRASIAVLALVGPFIGYVCVSYSAKPFVNWPPVTRIAVLLLGSAVLTFAGYVLLFFLALIKKAVP